MVRQIYTNWSTTVSVFRILFPAASDVAKGERRERQREGDEARIPKGMVIIQSLRGRDCNLRVFSHHASQRNERGKKERKGSRIVRAELFIRRGWTK